MMVFELSDIPRVIALAFLELLLSADNALVLGLLTRSLPPSLRKKALYIGVLSAFLLRALALASIAFLLQYIWVQLLGAAYLIYLSLSHFAKKRKVTTPAISHSFWKTVLLIELFDLAFAIDSIVAGVAFINSDPAKLWVVYIGGMIGLLGTRYAASFCGQLLDRFPRLESSVYTLIALIGIKLALSAFHFHMPAPLFWSAMVILFLLGFYKPSRLK